MYIIIIYTLLSITFLYMSLSSLFSGPKNLNTCQIYINFKFLSTKVHKKNAQKGSMFSSFPPWKISMEPTNHQVRRENDLPNLHDYVPC